MQVENSSVNAIACDGSKGKLENGMT